MTTAEDQPPEAISFEAPGLSPFSRAVLALLLLINLCLFAYLALRTPEQPQAPRRSLPSQEPLVAVSELSADERDALATRAAGSPERPPLAPGGLQTDQQVCRAWGPFPNDEQLAAVAGLVGPVASRQQTFQGTLEAPPDYLVYLETDNNLDNARRLLQELESQSVEAYVISGGEFLNAVSAGVFSNRSRAEALQERLETMGYKSRLAPLPRTESVRYLAAMVPIEFAVPGQTPSPCQEIASVRDFL